MVELVVVVPCFNEGRRLRAEGFRPLVDNERTCVLFVDDGSSDDTQRVLAEICAQLGPRASCLVLPQNRGKGEAVRQGMLAGLQMGAQIVAFLDADLATPAEEMLRLVATLRASRDAPLPRPRLRDGRLDDSRAAGVRHPVRRQGILRLEAAGCCAR